ncbi:MAG TPA: hypothetical protein VNI61_04485 [Gemmatimonadales bacterium]|nr:hypothetical protein [Gemmatimonadales bacterium]
MTRTAVRLSLPLLALARLGSAQVISIRTVPVAQGDQFELFPSGRLGMGGVAIALADTLGDPFSNPATVTRLPGAYVFGSPGVFRVSRRAGGGRSLPLGAAGRQGPWYGAMMLALQEVDAAQPTPFPQDLILLDRPLIDPPPGPELGPADRTHGNAYLFALLGKRFRDRGLSVGASLWWARLTALDGVDLLYAESARIRQLGQATDLRLGLLKDWSGARSLEAVLVHHRFGMTHEVTYLDPVWDPGRQQVVLRPRVEENADRTRTWGVQLQYQRPLGTGGWRIGWLGTVNRMSHPKIPNYEIMNIPRDPGTSHAYNLGIGVARTWGPAKFGVDLIYEPVWSHTWAEAAAPVETSRGDTIPAGGATIENRFRFSNALVRLGLSRDLELTGLGRVVSLQFGLVVRSVRYGLVQRDRVQGFRRTLEESWVEWAPTWGLSLRFPEFEIRYRGRAHHGTGRPGVAPDLRLAAAEAGANILVAPSGPLTLEAVTVVTHQVSFALPLR